jgi:hypothetical protein
MLPSAPAGVVFNPTQSFGGAQFIFASEDGTISAWSSGTQAAVKVDNSATAARYKALAIGSNGFRSQRQCGDRNIAGRGLGRMRRINAASHNRHDMQNQVCRHPGQSIVVIQRPPVFDPDVLLFNKSGFTQAFSKCS